MSKSHRKIDKNISDLAKQMRKNQTSAEQILWSVVLRKKQTGFSFRRQFPIDNKYIVDFICLEKRLIIELDGETHINEIDIKRDKERDAYLKKQGFIVLRFWNNDIFENLNEVYKIIMKNL